MGDNYCWGVRNDKVDDFLNEHSNQINEIQIDNIKKAQDILTIPNNMGGVAMWWIICKDKKLELIAEDDFWDKYGEHNKLIKNSDEDDDNYYTETGIADLEDYIPQDLWEEQQEERRRAALSQVGGGKKKKRSKKSKLSKKLKRSKKK